MGKKLTSRSIKQQKQTAKALKTKESTTEGAIQMKSKFFYDDHHIEVAKKIKNHLNSVPDYLSEQTATSPRATGDAIESLIADKLDQFLEDWCIEYSADFERRAMADIAFTDKEGFYCMVDVKTHREDTKFNMPNLTSVDRLKKFYRDDKNVFALIFVKYAVQGNKVTVTDVIFGPIESLNWECLTIGSLGAGQIQIANSNNVKVKNNFSRKQWMQTFCDTMLNFYPKEISKIKDRIEGFTQEKEFWQNQDDL